MRYKHPHGHVFYRKMSFARPKISHGTGIYLYDDQGKRYIDGSGGPLVVNVGHGRTEVVEAIAKQAQAVAYAHAMMFTSEPVEQFSEELAQIVPLPDARFFYLSSGSEVVEAAIKLARQIQMARGENGRHLIISRWRSYHGMSLGALSVSGKLGMRQPFLSMVHDMPHIAPPYPYRDIDTGAEAANRLESAILAAGAMNVAAFIAEPISGASLGAMSPTDDYWPRIREICDKYGVLFIADEVLVGMGRTGKWWGLQHWPVEADIMVTSKGLAGGYYPLGFVAARGADVEQIRQALGDFNHGGTFSHHAVGTAAGLATLRIMQAENLVENAATMGIYLGQELQKNLGDHPNVGDIRGRGLFWALELVQDRETKEPFPVSRHLAWDIWLQAFERGLVIYYSQGCADGTNGDLVMLGPPLIINKAQIDEMVAILAEAVRAELGN
ncbi:MAG: aminotransferase class III-fold pyridoxal phosphate-dependent enzyme [Ardenticatenaceae bacterium]|nr:aminotransferase class III-fold pyridoxal phosphate-dependent enzyme [Ardenticatenaceae bacterium]